MIISHVFIKKLTTQKRNNLGTITLIFKNSLALRFSVKFINRLSLSLNSKFNDLLRNPTE